MAFEEGYGDEEKKEEEQPNPAQTASDLFAELLGLSPGEGGSAPTPDSGPGDASPQEQAGAFFNWLADNPEAAADIFPGGAPAFQPEPWAQSPGEGAFAPEPAAPQQGFGDLRWYEKEKEPDWSKQTFGPEPGAAALFGAAALPSAGPWGAAYDLPPAFTAPGAASQDASFGTQRWWEENKNLAAMSGDQNRLYGQAPEGGNFLEQALEYMGRPGRGVAGLADVFMHNARGELSRPTTLQDYGDVFGAALEGRYRGTFADVLEEAGVASPVANVAGLGLDLVGDPLNFVGGVAGKGLKLLDETGKVVTKAPVIKGVAQAIGRTFDDFYDIKVAGYDNLARGAKELANIKDYNVQQAIKLGREVNKGLTEAEKTQFWDVADQGLTQYYSDPARFATLSTPQLSVLTRPGATIAEQADMLLPEKMSRLYTWYQGIYEPALRAEKQALGLTTTVDDYIFHYFPKLGEQIEHAVFQPKTPFLKQRTGAAVTVKDPGLSLAYDRAAVKYATEMRNFIDTALQQVGTHVQDAAHPSLFVNRGVRWYVPDEFIQTMNIIKDPVKTTELGKLIDTVTGVWKGSVTSLFPDFHVRNAISNITQNYLAGVTNPFSYIEASAVQDALRRASLLPGDVRSAQSGFRLSSPTASITDSIANRVLSKHGITIQQLQEAMGRQGFFPGHGAFNDIGQAVSDPMKTGILRELGIAGKRGAQVGAALGGGLGTMVAPGPGSAAGAALGAVGGSVLNMLSVIGRRPGEALETNAKLAHILNKLDNGLSLDDAVRSAQKYLFNYQDLSRTEKAVFRRVVPFYTWTRFAIPTMLEAMTTRPGKFVSIPKALNTAQREYLRTGGFTPMSNEERKSMPDYLAEQFGLQIGRDANGRPVVRTGFGLPQESLNFLLSRTPEREWIKLASMLNPIAAVPLQSIFGRSIYGSGEPIASADSKNPYNRAQKWMYDFQAPDGTYPFREFADIQETAPGRYTGDPEKMFILSAVASRMTTTVGRIEAGDLESVVSPVRTSTIYSDATPQVPKQPGLNPPPGVGTEDTGMGALRAYERREPNLYQTGPVRGGSYDYQGNPQYTKEYDVKRKFDAQMQDFYALREKEVTNPVTGVTKTVGEWEDELYSQPKEQQTAWRRANPAINQALNEKTKAKGDLLADPAHSFAAQYYAELDPNYQAAFENAKAHNSSLQKQFLERYNLGLRQGIINAPSYTSSGGAPAAAPSGVPSATSTGATSVPPSGAATLPSPAGVAPTSPYAGGQVGEFPSRVPGISVTEYNHQVNGMMDLLNRWPRVPDTPITFHGKPTTVATLYNESFTLRDENPKAYQQLQKDPEYRAIYDQYVSPVQKEKNKLKETTEFGPLLRYFELTATPNMSAEERQDYLDELRSATGKGVVERVVTEMLSGALGPQWVVPPLASRPSGTTGQPGAGAATTASTMIPGGTGTPASAALTTPAPTATRVTTRGGRYDVNYGSQPDYTSTRTIDSNKVISAASQFAGMPYVFGGGRGNDNSSVDCSSFVTKTISAATGGAVNLTPYTDAMYQQTQPVSGEPQAGDLVFYRGNDPTQPGTTFPHVAIYIGGGQVVDARASRGSVGTGNLQIPGYQVEFRRPGSTQVAAAPISVGDANGDQIISYARQKYGDDAARTIASILSIEGGLTGDIGDQGKAFGPFQFHVNGELGNFAAQSGMSLQEAAEYVRANPVEAGKWALDTYLGRALQQGISQGLTGADLATFVQSKGQRSQSPELVANHYRSLFGGQPTAPTPATARPAVGSRLGVPTTGTVAGTPAGTAGLTGTTGASRTDLVLGNTPGAKVAGQDLVAYNMRKNALADMATAYFDFGKGDPQWAAGLAAAETYGPLDPTQRAKFRAEHPDQYNAMRQYYDARDKVLASPDMESLQMYLAFLDEYGGDRNRRDAIESYLKQKKGASYNSYDWFLEALDMGWKPRQGTGLAWAGGGTSAGYAPRGGGGGGGGGYKKPETTPTGFAAFVKEAGAPILEDLEAYWKTRKPLSGTAYEYLRKLFTLYRFGASSFEEWLNTVLPARWREFYMGLVDAPAQPPAPAPTPASTGTYIPASPPSPTSPLPSAGRPQLSGFGKYINL